MFSELSNTGLLIATGIFFAIPVVILLLIKHRLGQKKPTYRWEPEQDYDVEWRGESMMQPASPVLKKRDNKPKS